MGRKKFAIAVAAVGMVAAMAPAAQAGATTHGSNPHAKICTLAKSEESGSTKSETQIVSAMESGNWAAAKKGLLATFNNGAKVESQAEAALSSAPGNVKAAGKTVLGLDSSEKQAIQSATSATQFETSMQSLEENPKIMSAESVLSKYYTGICGSIVPSTSTTPTAP